MPSRYSTNDFGKQTFPVTKATKTLYGVCNAIVESSEHRVYLIDYQDGSDDWLTVDEVFTTHLSLNNRKQRHLVPDAAFEHLKITAENPVSAWRRSEKHLVP